MATPPMDKPQQDDKFLAIGLVWTESQVKDCYLKGKITESQMNEILSYKKS